MSFYTDDYNKDDCDNKDDDINKDDIYSYIENHIQYYQERIICL